MTTIAVIGLGYVGLPLAVEFGKKQKTVGFDLHQEKVDAYARHVDPTGEVSSEDLKAAVHLTCSTDPKVISEADFIIVAVPTPVDEAHQPDFTPLVKSSESVGKYMKKGAIVVYESTVYPGATEEVCIPILEKFSGLKWKQDFNVGYSPERINPGDKERTVTKIMKVVSGDTPETLKKVEEVYASVITAGVYPASSIKVAEAAKVIENTQRDLNIALMNELAVIFHKIGIDTLEVLKAAGTKWNFLPFRPGLVGGHCIGVDPYYLTHKAQEIGYQPEVILAGRRINDGMGEHVANRVVRLMTRKRINVVDARVLILGLAFKENCPDLRNTRVVDVIAELRAYGLAVDVHDPWVSADEARAEYGLNVIAAPVRASYDAIVLCVAHREFTALGATALRGFGKSGAVLFDVKSVLPRADVDERL